MRWNPDLVAELGPDEATGKKLHSAAKTGGVEKVRSILTEAGLNPAVAGVIVTAVRCYGENEVKVKAASGSRTTKIAAEQLLGVLRRTNPANLKEAETIAAKMAECEREASLAHQTMEAARVAEIENGGLLQRFGHVFNGPCRLINNQAPAAVSAELLKLGIGSEQYPWTAPTEATWQPAQKPRVVRSAADTMREVGL